MENYPILISAHPVTGTPFEFCRKNYPVKRWDIYLLYSEDCMILSAVVLLQCTRVTDDHKRQTDRQHVIQLQRSAENAVTLVAKNNDCSNETRH